MGDADEDDDDEPINPLVDALFDEVENLRMKVCFALLLLFNALMIYLGYSFSNLRCAVRLSRQRRAKR